MTDYVLGLDRVDEGQVAVVGGKGANLGAVSKIDGIAVPPGFCVTAEAFRTAMASLSLEDSLDELAGLSADDHERIRAVSAELRDVVEGTAVPDDIADAITQALAAEGSDERYAVRSSATAEDLPSASFAGQHDTYLDVAGAPAVLRHVARCWASLFSERAVSYRLRNGYDGRAAAMAVVVQRMVDADASGVLFTADPLTSNRTVTVIEAVRGLGDALVSGRANADGYAVRRGAITTRTIAGDRPLLSDAQVTELDRTARRIEAHFGAPQDIEWCLRDGAIQIVQSRPITTLFPVPDVDDAKYRVYLSVGHQQMMTDAWKPLGISVWQLTAPAPMRAAGGRLFVDVTDRLVSPPARAGLLQMIGRHDPLFRDALETAIEQGGFPPSRPGDGPAQPYFPPPAEPIETDPALVAELIGKAQDSLTELEKEIRTKAGPEVFDYIRRDLQEVRPGQIDPRSLPAIMAGMEAAWWINDHMLEWLGETNAADALTQSVTHNVTSEMGMALLDVADAVRRHPEVVTYLQSVEGDDGFLGHLPSLPGGDEVRAEIQAWLDRYGMRCVGEIDITRPRWSERPGILVPVILTNVRNVEPGERQRRFDQGLAEARETEHRLLGRLRELPDSEAKAAETKRMIDRLRTFAGYREHPKYAMINRYFVLKQAILHEVRRLVAAGVLDELDDAFFLTFDELHDAVRTGSVDRELLLRRREEFLSYQALTPPRVLTSEGGTISGRFRRDGVPARALVGLAVSAGVVEGRARVVHDLGEADLEAGDILVTAFTDPSWSPVFLTVAGLVTEVGGQMTHGAVIAREYGLPAVVAIERATRLIEDGQRIRVHGTDGYVEILPPGQQR
ncbi:MAG: phosphoenolpyruvate synthase [Jatrophihabitans sp.]|uniref:phosphoenolpyruvate synthase n=1 Tax=Jatrophihabitans sp. TaxID=1932789 RepID=UPI0039129939